MFSLVKIYVRILQAKIWLQQNNSVVHLFVFSYRNVPVA